MKSEEETIEKYENLFDRALYIGVSDLGQIKLVKHYYNLLKEKQNDQIGLHAGNDFGIEENRENHWESEQFHFKW